MLKREKISNELSFDLKFMDDRWDKALLGYAESGGPGRYILPCYGYQALKAILRERGYDGRDTYTALQVMYSEMPSEPPLILSKLNRTDLWKKATSNNYMRWESLDSAVLGIGKIKYTTTGLVYSKPLCIDLLARNCAATDKNTKLVNAINKLEEELIPVEAPEYTPWYLTPIR